MTPEITVIASVWRHQRDKDELLRGHMRNLARQTVPHRVIYVFDGGDPPPPWLGGMKVTVSGDLTIYQAWNVALSLVTTPLVANLNLDDRLAPEGLAMLSAPFRDDPEVFLTGGDWRICYSAEETDAVRLAVPVAQVPFVQEWPPAPPASTRLGSGDGTRDTFGPATMWRMEAHLGYPRYPYRFVDGTLIRVIGDFLWWNLLLGPMKKKSVRLPYVIGHYRSWPDSQAEFRHDAAAEHRQSRLSPL